MRDASRALPTGALGDAAKQPVLQKTAPNKAQAGALPGKASFLQLLVGKSCREMKRGWGL